MPIFSYLLYIFSGKIQCSARVDLAFLMDASGSIGEWDFQKERDFVKAMASSFTFARDQTLAAVITYNNKAYLDIPFGRHLNTDSFRLEVDQIRYTLGQTRIDKALAAAAEKVFAPGKGTRQGFPKVIVILTDGVQTKDPDAIPLGQAVLPLRRKGVQIIAVGVGGHSDPNELRQMVERSSDVYTVTDFDDLLKKAYDIAKRTCDGASRPRGKFMNVFTLNLYPKQFRRNLDYTGQFSLSLVSQQGCDTGCMKHCGV